MAALTNTQVWAIFTDGLSDRLTLYALRGVNSGDTINLVSDFISVRQAVVIGTTVLGEAVATISGNTTVTMPAGLSVDSGWLLVWGAHA